MLLLGIHRLNSKICQIGFIIIVLQLGEVLALILEVCAVFIEND